MADSADSAGKIASTDAISISRPLTQSIAWPLADATLAQEIFDLLQQATHYRQVKKGANEGIFLLLVYIPNHPGS